MTLPQGYFDDLYARADDPWSFRERWYEQRKREISVASLPHRRYARAFEAGCSIGLLTATLAGRCDELLAVDVSEPAVQQAAREVASCPQVRVERRTLPSEWPTEKVFDLIVVSEVGYYLDAPDLIVLLDRTVGSLAPGGVLLACHWRHPVADYPQSGDDVHRALGDRLELVRVVHHEETDFLLEVFTQGRQPTVAQWEGLVEPTFNSGITCNETTVHAGHPPAQAREPQMTSNTPVPIGPANSAEADDEKASVDSVEADRLASQGEDTSTVEQRDGDEETDSADADYDASMGKEPETD